MRFSTDGGYALELDGGCEGDKIIGNDMFDLGAGGVRVGESKMDQAVRFPCGHDVITDNHIHQTGLVQMPGMGILVLLSDHNVIAHNEVDHTFQTAISVGWPGATPAIRAMTISSNSIFCTTSARAKPATWAASIHSGSNPEPLCATI